MSDGTSNPDPSIFWQVEHPAKRGAFAANKKDWPILVLSWPLSIADLLHACNLGGSSGKMWWEPCIQTEEGILEPSSQRWGTSAMGGATECWTLDISESPSPEDESFLLRSVETVLETGDIPQRFFASVMACKGLLRRDLNRGMKLSDALRDALNAMTTSEQKTDTCESTQTASLDGSCLWKLNG